MSQRTATARSSARFSFPPSLHGSYVPSVVVVVDMSVVVRAGAWPPSVEAACIKKNLPLTWGGPEVGNCAEFAWKGVQ